MTRNNFLNCCSPECMQIRYTYLQIFCLVELMKTKFSYFDHITSIQRECPARCNRGQEKPNKIRVVKLYCLKDFFSKFKGLPSQEEHKTNFSVLTTIELQMTSESEYEL